MHPVLILIAAPIAYGIAAGTVVYVGEKTLAGYHALEAKIRERREKKKATLHVVGGTEKHGS